MQCRVVGVEGWVEVVLFKSRAGLRRWSAGLIEVGLG